MHRFNNILFAVENAEADQPALARAVTLAEHNQARLTVVDVLPPLPSGIGMPQGGPRAHDLQAAMLREHDERMTALLAPFRDRLDIGHEVLVGTPFLEVIRSVLRNSHDLVIKCPESPGWLDRFFSGDDMHLLRKCPCPVWFIKPGAPKTYQRILAALDVDDGYPEQELETRRRLNIQILEMATSLAISESAELHLVHAWESLSELANGLAFSSDIPAEQLRENIAQERRQQHALVENFIEKARSASPAVRDALDYLRVSTHLPQGSARRQIPRMASELQVDCIVMGTVARTGIRGFIMGNTAETILEQIDCSVLAIKPPGFVTPVAAED